MTILVVNAGSSTLKFATFERAAGALKLRFKDQVEGTGDDALQALFVRLAQKGIEVGQLTGAGHRIVHGGTEFSQPVIVDDTIEAKLNALRPLAPLHQPYGLDALRAMRERAPNVPQVACFDTAFHATQPEIATRFPLPRSYFERGYRRYGFHGLNYEHVVRALPLETGQPLPRRLLIAHLGNGASLCAVLDGRSIATSMGYSTLDGLVMGTRPGALDPGLILAIMKDDRLSPEQMEQVLYKESGLLALSGLTSDVRSLLESPMPEARAAIEAYCYWAARQAASLIAAMGGIDAMVFTGGVGENAEPVRARVINHLSWIKAFSMHIVLANEELIIAQHTSALLT
ncbi:acetate kinase [Nordella sp. HKS 07]|uniref:acetate/propionate family kinase n=1 Tax=Nordella sp. HKS 07 TaxID=2712222 RepID=UPI0013E19D29|nr:acetate kinase [Nordella sp. HKS 07]QIG50206.1 acetate kinase [Nordella sp. HKS 07]